MGSITEDLPITSGFDGREGGVVAVLDAHHIDLPVVGDALEAGCKLVHPLKDNQLRCSSASNGPASAATVREYSVTGMANFTIHPIDSD